MTKGQIDELMRNNGIVVVGEAVYRLCNLIEVESASKEREACAEVCELMYDYGWLDAKRCAREIRARGKE